MEMKTAYPATLEDLIFEGRNKAYGAYMLRKLYPKHVIQSVIMAITASVLLLLLPSAINKVLGHDDLVLPKTEKPDDKIYDMTEVVLPPITSPVAPPEPQPAATQPVAKTITFTTPKVVEETHPTEADVPPVEAFKTADAGTVNAEGTGGEVGMNANSDAGTGNGTGTGVGNAAAAPGYIFDRVEIMPEFNGGIPALMKFIGKELKYPIAAQRAAIEGNVIVSFVVSPTGDVTNITILKGLGYGTEEEAIRVLKKLPRWKPGNQNGMAVPVRMTLPIRLQLK